MLKSFPASIEGSTMPPPYKNTAEEWHAAKVHAVRTLMAISRNPELDEEERFVTYGDLTTSIQEVVPKVVLHYHGTPLRVLLDEIGRASHEAAGCWINFLVVNKKRGRPGKGARKQVRAEAEEEAAKTRRRQQKEALRFLRFSKADTFLDSLRRSPT